MRTLANDDNRAATGCTECIGCHAHACVGMNAIVRFARPACPRKRGHGTRLLILAIGAALLLGCRAKSDDVAEGPAEDDGKVARSEVERGPVRVTVEVEPAKARLSDEPTLTLTIDYERGVSVQKPPFGESLGDFLIRDYHEPLPQVTGSRETLRQIYTLEPTRTGELPVYPISVTFTDDRSDGDGKQHTVETEGLTVEIASVVGAELPSLEELRPPAGPVELPTSGRFGVLWLLAAVPVAVAAAAAWWWKRRRRAVEVKPPSPRELAYLELAQLIEAGLAEQDVKQYYVELTGVVRRYIERTTGIHAPEQTTEEFLWEIGRKDTFPEVEGQRLKDFLESADLVKFAAHEPRKQEIEESFQRAKVFIGLETVEAAA